ncbi:MAG: hypothetical protein JOZ55_07565 [Alphaproteobacteria bacterium]|nr:hypothetical protein [Alphaproteobacteria bacterium]
MPDLSVAGVVNNISISDMGVNFHETDYGAKAEWLVMEDFPVSVTGSYEHANVTVFGFSGSTDIWTVGLKLNLNSSGPVTLVEHNRTGTLDTIGSALQPHF